MCAIRTRSCVYDEMQKLAVRLPSGSHHLHTAPVIKDEVIAGLGLNGGIYSQSGFE